MRVVHRIVTGLVLLALAACGAAETRVPHPLHPIPEMRAAALVARTFRDAGVAPEADRYVRIARDRRLRLEVAAAGHKYGVAYLTADDWTRYGDALPQRPKDDSLVIAFGDGGQRILCLFAGDYAEDDMEGDDRTTTTIAADRRLQRDVRDFLHRAQQQGWP